MEWKSRKNVRLSDYDYAGCGAYFVTICTHGRRKILSTIRRDDPCGRPKAVLTQLGEIAERTFSAIETSYGITVIEAAIMPDHIHAIVFLPGKEVSGKAVKLAGIVGAYKSIIANEWLKICKSNGMVMGKLWQTGYYDHVIRNDTDMRETIEYIQGNPIRWCEKHDQG